MVVLREGRKVLKSIGEEANRFAFETLRMHHDACRQTIEKFGVCMELLIFPHPQGIQGIPGDLLKWSKEKYDSLLEKIKALHMRF